MACSCGLRWHSPTSPISCISCPCPVVGKLIDLAYDRPPQCSYASGDTLFPHQSLHQSPCMRRCSPRHGIKWAVLSAPLSLSLGVEVLASGTKGARLVTLVEKGNARKTAGAVLAAQVSQCVGMMVENVGVNSKGASSRALGRLVFKAGAISSSVVAKYVVLRQHRLALLPPHLILRPHSRCYAGSKVGYCSCFNPKW